MSEYSLHPTLLLFPSIAADSSSLVCKQVYKRISAFDGLESTSPTCIMLLKIKLSVRYVLPHSLFIILRSRKDSLTCDYPIIPVEIFLNQEVEGTFLEVKI